MSHVRDTEVLHRIARSFSTGSLSLDDRSWEFVKSQALQKARLVRETAARAASADLPVRSPTPSRVRDDPADLPPVLLSFTKGSLAPLFARLFICLYFINVIYDDYAAWKFLQSPDMQLRIRLNPDRFPAATFPTFKFVVLLPCVFFVALGVRVPFAKLLLPIQLFHSSWRMIWHQFLALFEPGSQIDELPLKKMAVGGAIILLLACSTRAGRRMNSYAGLLVLEDQNRISTRKSVVLLICRLLMSSLFIFLGCAQAARVLDRDMKFWKTRHWQPADGHDNNWLLLELLLSFPFVLGFKTQAVSRALGSVVLLEAFTCWPFWAHSYPTWHYAAHVRSHFFTNLAVAGGLLLMQASGAGSFSLDAYMMKKKAS